MKRKRLPKPPKSGRVFPSKKVGDVSCFSDKKSSPIPQNNDFQNINNSFFNLIGIGVEQYIKRNPSSLLTLIHSQPILTPPIKIFNSCQELNFSEEITYKISRHIGCLRPEIINEIHSVFHNNSLIGTTSENFIPHLTGGLTKARKIIWLDYDNVLTFIFEELMEKIFPHSTSPSEILADHFCDFEGNDYTAEQLRKSHSKGIQLQSKKDRIKKMFSTLLNK